MKYSIDGQFMTRNGEKVLFCEGSTEAEMIVIREDYQAMADLEAATLEVERLANAEAKLLIQYQDDRRNEYPTIEALVVAIMEDKEGRPQALVEALALRLEVKTKFPKPI